MNQIAFRKEKGLLENFEGLICFYQCLENSAYHFDNSFMYVFGTEKNAPFNHVFIVFKYINFNIKQYFSIV